MKDLKHRRSNSVFIERESKRIGNIIIIEFIWNSMEKGIKVYIEDSAENRSKVLIKEYIKGNDSVKELVDCLDNFKNT